MLPGTKRKALIPSFIVCYDFIKASLKIFTSWASKLNFFITKLLLIFERFIQLGKHVKIAINISITGAFGGILSTVIGW